MSGGTQHFPLDEKHSGATDIEKPTSGNNQDFNPSTNPPAAPLGGRKLQRTHSTGSLPDLDTTFNTTITRQFTYQAPFSTSVITREDFRILVGITSADYSKLDIEANALTTPGSLRAIRNTQPTYTTQLAVSKPKTFFHPFKRGNIFENEGLYRHVCLEEERTRWRYHGFNSLVNFSLIAQLCLSAAVIALGAQSGDFHIPVTVIGAFNGVLAGTMSLIKGQGLPGRLLQYRNALRRVREAVERVDRILSIPQRPGSPPITYLDVEAIFSMYDEAKKIAEQNHPDIWNSETSEVRKMIDQTPGMIFTSDGKVLGHQDAGSNNGSEPGQFPNTKTPPEVNGARDKVMLGQMMTSTGGFQPGNGVRNFRW